MKNEALITGASSGIGKEFARIHAQNGGDLFIVARRENKLIELKTELQDKYNVQVRVITKDLTLAEAPAEIYEEVKKAGIEVAYLINNAGFGGRGKFHEREWTLISVSESEETSNRVLGSEKQEVVTLQHCL